MMFASIKKRRNADRDEFLVRSASRDQATDARRFERLAHAIQECGKAIQTELSGLKSRSETAAMSAAFLLDTMDHGDAPENSERRTNDLTETLVACQSRIVSLTAQRKMILELEHQMKKMIADVGTHAKSGVGDRGPDSVKASMDQDKTQSSAEKIRQGCAALLIASACALPPLVLGSDPSFAQDLNAGKSFVDEFRNLDSNRWYVADGWANGDHQNCTWSKDAVGISDEMLVLQFKEQIVKDRDYACGEVQTYNRFGYGVYEARIKTGSGSGLNAAFFTYIGPVHNRPHDEIDFEVLLKDTSKVQVNYYAAGKGKNEALIPLESGTDSAFNDYAFVWEPGQLHWYVNGKLVHQTTQTDTLPSYPQKIYFSLWGSDTFVDWMGPFSAPDDPVLMHIDRVAFTRLDEPCQFAGSVACNFETSGN